LLVCVNENVLYELVFRCTLVYFRLL
jgi:hypothetical protein